MDFQSDEFVRCLPCGHVFHDACVRQWVRKSATAKKSQPTPTTQDHGACPMCRGPIVPTGPLPSVCPDTLSVDNLSSYASSEEPRLLSEPLV
jgi:hypothetical protein